MMDKACLFYKNHLLARPEKLVLSVNVSRLGLLKPGFVETYTAIKERYGIPDGCIELEFTESIAFENHELFQNIVNEFRQNGFLCSLDDFGSGHSALNLLKTLQLDILKLDRLFFIPSADPRRGFALVRSMIDMAITLGMSTVAEGVESMDQVNALRRIGCDVVQGYVFSRPLPIDGLLEFLTAFGKK
jgi:EAL domain-containing protein (putative c-di-GMP-specific phosphodiesterase class I)